MKSSCVSLILELVEVNEVHFLQYRSMTVQVFSTDYQSVNIKLYFDGAVNITEN